MSEPKSQTQTRTLDSHESRTASPSSNSSTHITISDRAISIVALTLAALAIGIIITMPVIIEAKVQAGIADARADMQQQLAKVEATANAGREHGRIALSEVERANAELAAKGLIRKAEH
jgi:hypothetical protein